MEKASEQKIILQGISVDELLQRIESRLKVKTSHPEEDQILTIQQASDYLKLSCPTLNRMKAENRIPFKKIGARVLFSKRELTKWLSAK